MWHITTELQGLLDQSTSRKPLYTAHQELQTALEEMFLALHVRLLLDQEKRPLQATQSIVVTMQVRKLLS